MVEGGTNEAGKELPAMYVGGVGAGDMDLFQRTVAADKVHGKGAGEIVRPLDVHTTGSAEQGYRVEVSSHFSGQAVVGEAYHDPDPLPPPTTQS